MSEVSWRLQLASLFRRSRGAECKEQGNNASSSLIRSSRQVSSLVILASCVSIGYVLVSKWAYDLSCEKKTKRKRLGCPMGSIPWPPPTQPSLRPLDHQTDSCRKKYAFLISIIFLLSTTSVQSVQSVLYACTDTTCVLQEVCKLHICNASNIKYRDL